jgi:capsular polysaccharide biosynthesis protein
LDEALTTGAQDQQVFVARPSTLHRRITNFSEIEGFLAARGFSVFFPEQHPFGEQMRTVRESRNLVIKRGSGALALLLGRPGKKTCYLVHHACTRYFLSSELLKNLDIEMKIVSGPFENKTEPYVDQSDYRIPLDYLKPTIENWMG